METSLEEFYFQNLQDDMKTLVDRLAVIGLDSVVLVTSRAIQLQFGSTKGKQFLGDNPNYFEDFIEYCRDEVKAQTIDKIGSDVYQIKSRKQVSNLNDVTIRPIKFAVKKLTPKDEQIDTQIMPEAMFLEPELISEISQKHAIGDENIPDINYKVTHQNQDRIIDTNNDTKETTICNINSEQNKSMPVTRMAKSVTPKQETKEISESNSQQMMDGTVTANLSLNGDFHESDADRSTCEEDTEINKNYLQSQINEALQDLKGQDNQASPSHSPLITSTQQRTFNCDQCDKKYRSKKALVVHQRLHTGEAPFICQTCGKAFRSGALLKSHLTIHSTELNYKCKLCDKAFQWRDTLRRHHISIHQERRYVCEQCGSDFCDLSALKKHKLRHSGEKNHECSVCGKRFMLKYRLSEHMRVHTGIKKFECGVCHRQFADRRDALKHQNEMHPDHGHLDLIVHH